MVGERGRVIDLRVGDPVDEDEILGDLGGEPVIRKVYFMTGT